MRFPITTSGWLGVLPLLLCATGRAEFPQRPNILFIMADDHAAHAISAYGSRINRTPNIDRLATEGMRFDRCFCVNSICTPSRASILTGQYSHITGVTVFNPLPTNTWTFPQTFQRAGYQTGLIGKWHLTTEPQGFDYWSILPGQGRYHDPDFIELGKKQTLKGYATDIITDLSLEFLAKRDRARPFLLLVHHKAPHREWSPDSRHAHMYEGVTIPLPATFADTYEGRSDAAKEATMTVERHLTRNDLKIAPPAGLQGDALDSWKRGTDAEIETEVDGKNTTLAGEELKRWKYQRYIKDYLRCIASVDDNVGRLLDYLEQTGLKTNTVVIYTSDQGFFLGDHGWFDKRFMYEESLRMPLLIRYPGKTHPGRVTDAMILNVDFAPTLLAAAGLSAPSALQGRSFLPLLAAPAPDDWRTSMYYRYYHYPGDHQVQPHYGVRTGRHKLIFFNRLNQWELYDLKTDPQELRNVYADPAFAAEREALKAELTRLRKDLDDHDQFQERQN